MENRGIGEGVAVTLGIGMISSLLVKWIGTSMLHPIAGTLLAYITLAACVLYFGVQGVRTIPVGFIGIKLWLGKRVAERMYPEGLVWNWPEPIGGIEIKDGRDKPLDLPLTEVLTEDNVPVDIAAALQIKIVDLNTYLGADRPEESLKNATESDIRSIVLKLKSVSVAQEKQVIIDALLGEKLDESERLWGIKVLKVRITHIRLPKILEEARTEVQVETARQAKEIQQAIAEKTEAEHVAAMIGIYVKAGLSPQAAADIAQTERGKTTRIILDGGAKPIERAGALAGGLLNSKPQSPPPANPTPRGQRRRGNT